MFKKEFQATNRFIYSLIQRIGGPFASFVRVVICIFLNFNVPVAIIINLRVSDVSLCKERGKRRYHQIGGDAKV